VHLLKQREIRQVIVFSNTKIGASRLARELERAGVKASAIHGDKTQGERMAALEAFKAGGIDVLVATDVAARGLDIAELPCVINYDLPYNAEDYVHRIGRTGRAGASGDALSLYCDKDARLLADIEKLIKQKLVPVELEDFHPRSGRGERADRGERSARADRQSDRQGDRYADRSERRTERGPRAASAPIPRKEKVDPWFLKPYEPAAPAVPTEAKPADARNAKTPPKRAALLGGRSKG
jgi:superfamily II DNA/RNA helicase